MKEQNQLTKELASLYKNMTDPALRHKAKREEKKKQQRRHLKEDYGI